MSNRVKPWIHYDSEVKCNNMRLANRAVARKEQFVL